MRVLGILPFLLATSVSAQEDLRIDMSRLHVTDPAACAVLEDRGVDAWLELDFRVLTFDRGIQSMEFDCRFFDVKSSDGGTHLFVDAVCSTPGEFYPDILALAPVSDTQIQVVSNRDANLALTGLIEPQSAEGPPGATLYTRCDNLSEIPR